MRRGSLCGLFPYLALITGTGAELVRDLAGSCRISAQSVPQVTVWHNPNGENTEIKLPFAPLATCRMTVRKAALRCRSTVLTGLSLGVGPGFCPFLRLWYVGFISLDNLLDHCRTDLLKILNRQHDLMPHKEEAGMADPDMLKIKSISCAIKGYAHKRVSKDGLPDITAVM